MVIAALLGAEEFGFATAPLVVAGCVMMRVCHLDTCPVGIATQNPVLRERFTGKAEFVETFFLFLAEQVREYLAALGFRTITEAVGHAELLDIAPAVDHHRARGLDLAPLLAVADIEAGHSCTNPAQHDLSDTLDAKFIVAAAQTLEDGSEVDLTFDVRNVNRTVGTMLGSEVTRRFGPEGLPTDTIRIALAGTAGQSLGAFLPNGISITLTGDANDYVAKGLSGGHIVVRPAENSPAQAPGAKTQVIAGNTIGYGATSGELYLRGRVGERFAVRNSGALMVTEGTGDHALRIHDGRPGRHPRPDRTQRRSGHERRHRLPARPRPQPDQHGTGGHRSLGRRRSCLARRGDRGSRPVHGFADGEGAAGRPGRPQSARFSRVMPRDYRKVLALQAQAAETGVDADELIMEASRG